MSEEKPVPCAFCGEEPVSFEGDWLGCLHCPTKDCILANSGGYGPNQWDLLNSAFMQQRRKDFEAGADSADAYRSGACWTPEELFELYIKDQSK